MDSLRVALHWTLILVAVFSATPVATAAPPRTARAGYDCRRSGCHVDPRGAAAVHRLVEEGDCAACHQPGAPGGESHPEGIGESAIAEASRLTNRECLSCHAAAFEPSRQERLSSENPEPRPLEAELHRHGGVAEGRCDECHRVHAGSPKGLLRGAFPVADYAPYDRTVYSACFESCHSPNLVEEERTATATRFRNGDDNLHFRHVAARSRGRSCRLCHASHQARNPGLVRSGMPFGKERLTLKFAAGETGGRCETSCHLPAEYDRTEAIPSRMRVLEPASNLEETP